MSRLERLLRPKSIAVIGGGAFGANVVQQCLKMGFSGDIWPVHPKKDEVEGVKAYRTVADLPGAAMSELSDFPSPLVGEGGRVKRGRMRGAPAGCSVQHPSSVLALTRQSTFSHKGRREGARP